MRIIKDVLRMLWAVVYELVKAVISIFKRDYPPVTGRIDGPGIFSGCINIAAPTEGTVAKPWAKIGLANVGDLNTVHVLVKNDCQGTRKKGLGLQDWVGQLGVAKSNTIIPTSRTLTLDEDIAKGQLGYASTDFRLAADQFASEWQITVIAGQVATVCGKSVDQSKVLWAPCPVPPRG